MDDVIFFMNERESEFNVHMSIAIYLENNMINGSEEGLVGVRQINTIKSGIIIHLYNIVESVMNKILRGVGDAAINYSPVKWKDNIRKEWIRAQVFDGEGIVGDSAIDKLSKISNDFFSSNRIDAFPIKGVPGSWDINKIEKISTRLGCSINAIDDDVKRGAHEKIYDNETCSLEYLAKKRNAIAHGHTTFQEGVGDKTLGELADLANRVMCYLRAVVDCYKFYLENEEFLVYLPTNGRKS